jgi:hypothetical protein
VHKAKITSLQQAPTKVCCAVCGVYKFHINKIQDFEQEYHYAKKTLAKQQISLVSFE